jgi:hypothetical protein
MHKLIISAIFTEQAADNCNKDKIHANEDYRQLKISSTFHATRDCNKDKLNISSTCKIKMQIT